MFGRGQDMVIMNANVRPVGKFQCTKCGKVMNESELRCRALPDGRIYYYCSDIRCESAVDKVATNQNSLLCRDTF